jgi:RimJ/RimL family protein N-acetyltransferase
VTGEPLVLAVPDLGTERLRLRPWGADDFPALVRAWHDPAVIAGSTPPRDRSPSAARRWIEGVDERRRAGSALDLVIVGASPGDGTDGGTDDAVWGEVGLSQFDATRRAAAVGWWVAAEHRGKGVATEAVTLFTRWALEPGRLRALFARIGADNPASVRVATAAGYVPLEPARNPQPDARGTAPSVWYVAHSTVKRVP